MKTSGKLYELTNLLNDLNKKGLFEASWIIDFSGLFMAEAIQEGLNKETASAISSVVLMYSDRICDCLHIPDEYALHVMCENLHLYFRRISVDQTSYMLVATSQKNRIKMLQTYAHKVLSGHTVQEKSLDWASKEIERYLMIEKNDF